MTYKVCFVWDQIYWEMQYSSIEYKNNFLIVNNGKMKTFWKFRKDGIIGGANLHWCGDIGLFHWFFRTHVGLSIFLFLEISKNERKVTIFWHVFVTRFYITLKNYLVDWTNSFKIVVFFLTVFLIRKKNLKN